MNILFIDYRSIKAHQNFNKIHIDVLIRQGHVLTLLGKKGQYDNIYDTPQLSKKVIPDVFFKKFPLAQISERLREIICLFWIMKKFNLSSFDLIIIPTYDILSFFLFRIKNKTLIINHNNVSQLDNKVKLWLTKTLPRHYIHIALNTRMREQLIKLLPGMRVYYIPHGILNSEINERVPSFINKGVPFLFCPINSNFDFPFLQRIISSEELDKYLKCTGQILYVKKSIGLTTNSSNIIHTSSISDLDYNYMLSHAKTVLLPYGREFKYRCSGILFECVNFNVPVLATDIEDMVIYKDVVNITFFNDVSSLIDGLEKISQTSSPQRDNSSLYPDKYWEEIIKNVIDNA